MPDALEKLNKLKDAVYDVVGQGWAAEVIVGMTNIEVEQAVRLRVE